jgi:hypothetical protein
LRKKPGVYSTASAAVFRAANDEDVVEAGRPNPNQRSPEPKLSQSPMTATKITHKNSAARHSIAPRVDTSCTTATCTEDFVAVVAVGYESENDRTEEEQYEKIRWKEKVWGPQNICLRGITAAADFHQNGSNFFGLVYGLQWWVRF